MRWVQGELPRFEIPGSGGWRVHLKPNILRTVLFLGYEDKKSPTGFKCEGTGFLFHYQGEGYLVTARHVADKLKSDPFQIRVNRSGKAELLTKDRVKWTRHPDKLVDLAATPIRLVGGDGFETDYLVEQFVLTPTRIAEEDISIGDYAYTVGLFHFVHGRGRNLPMAHTGYISLMPPPGETIPVGNEAGETEWVEAYLIESRAINGASGSPVFARPTLTMRDVTLDKGRMTTGVMGEGKLYLLGLFQAAWFLPPDDPLRKTVRSRTGDVVPVGLGVVVPAYKIIELLEDEELKKQRAVTPPFPIVARKAGVSGEKQADPPANDENPNHLEDFKRLEALAVRKPEQAS